MNVCNDCLRFGEEIAPRQQEGEARIGSGTLGDRLAARERRQSSRNVLDQMDLELVDDFGTRIRKAREKKGWTREELANRVQQPVPTVTKYESQQLHPADETVKSLERELGIKLMEEVPRGTIPQRAPPGSRGMTLGDILKDAQKKQK